MYKLYKKDGTEVQFSTEEGMLKTLEAFPDKYSKGAESVNKESFVEEIKEPELEEEITEINLDEE